MVMMRMMMMVNNDDGENGIWHISCKDIYSSDDYDDFLIQTVNFCISYVSWRKYNMITLFHN